MATKKLRPWWDHAPQECSIPSLGKLMGCISWKSCVHDHSCSDSRGQWLCPTKRQQLQSTALGRLWPWKIGWLNPWCLRQRGHRPQSTISLPAVEMGVHYYLPLGGKPAAKVFSGLIAAYFYPPTPKLFMPLYFLRNLSNLFHFLYQKQIIFSHNISLPLFCPVSSSLTSYLDSLSFCLPLERK